jgi:hypothetical protein
MDKRKAYHDKLDKVLNVFLSDDKTADVVLEETTLEDGTVIQYADKNVGTPVMVIVEGQDPAPVADGDYKISDTEILVVKEGVIAEVKAPEAEVETPAEGAVVDAETATPAVEVANDPASIFNLDKLSKIIDLSKEGFHTLTFSVANGKVEWGNLYSESFQELKEQLTASQEEIKAAKLKFEEDLKILGKTVKETKLVQAPVELKTVPQTAKERKIAAIMEQRKQPETEN